MDVREVIVQLRAGVSQRQIAEAMQISRNTVKKYRTWAQEQELLSGELPDVAELRKRMDVSMAETLPPQQRSSVAPHGEVVARLRREGVEIAAIWERLKERGYTGSYQAVWRFVQQLETQAPDATVRVECQPGEEAQIDFGYAGLMIDEATDKARKTWAFVMTLSWSRHQYVEFVFDQKVETWLRLHRNAFAFFNGVPRCVVVDNLKAAIIKACWDDPQVQQAYRECAEHYGFRIAPCRPNTPEHKGKVEQGGVHYVKRNFVAGRQPTTLVRANQDVHTWCLTTAGQRIHGTTREKPLVRFEETEQTQLRPLPETAYDMAVWKIVKLYRDGYVTFDNAYYSVPFRFVGQQLRVRGGLSSVRVYTLDYQLVATHTRAARPGERQTHLDHLPPEKVSGVTWNRERCQAMADEIGPATAEIVSRLLNDPVVERVASVRRLLKLCERFDSIRLEAACARALAFEDASYKTVKGILQRGMEQQGVSPITASPPARTFVRSATELIGHLFGGVTWS